MNREEILKKSREENMGRDIPDQETAKNSVMKGWMVTVFLSSVFLVVDGIVFSRLSFEMLSAVLAGLSVVFFTKYFTLKKRHELYIAILYGLASVLFFISWIIQMARI